ncbi:MAG: hypothetical protein SYR96_29925 [Actinomycetota bacterium]|nr:hypothetical protein [Actinomycetota bacterium]
MAASEESSREELISLLADRDARIAAQDAQIRSLSTQVADLLDRNEKTASTLTRPEHLAVARQPEFVVAAVQKR